MSKPSLPYPAYHEKVGATARCSTEGQSVISQSGRENPPSFLISSCFTVVTALMNPAFFARIKGDIDIHGGKIHVPQWIGQGGLADFTLSGWLDYKGRMVQSMTLVLSKQLCDSLPALVSYSLVPLGEGRNRLRLILSGTIADPLPITLYFVN